MSGGGAAGKSSKLLALIDSRLRVTISDRRVLIGTFAAFDKHLNLVLLDCEEHRTVSDPKATLDPKTNLLTTKVQKRLLGLVILRGENVISITVEGPPPSKGTAAKAQPGGPGVVKPLAMGRGAPVGGAPQGLGSAPAYGVGVGAGMVPQGGGYGRGR